MAPLSFPTINASASQWMVDALRLAAARLPHTMPSDIVQLSLGARRAQESPEQIVDVALELQKRILNIG